MEKQIIKRNRGFTLIEILIALAIMSIITTAIYQLYISQFKTWQSQDLVTELQQSGRFAVDTMTREMQLIGYDLPANTEAVTLATPTQFTFRSRDNSIITSGDQRREVSFRLNGANLEMGVSTWDGSAFPAITGWDVLAENVTGFALTYYNDEGNTVTNANEVRRVKVSLTMRTSRKDPLTGDYKSLTLVTEVRPRNLGIGEVSSDVTPPAVPTGLQVVDPGKCGTLKLMWDKNTEVDLSGYTVYYSLVSRSDPAFPGYTGRVSAGISGADGYELTGLTTTASNAATPSIYYITLDAFDENGNHSGITTSTEISENPSPSLRAFGGANDTTVNMEKPTPPTNFKGEDAGANQVKLTWTLSTDTNVIGYRVYRSTSAFTTFPIPEGLRIADEGTLSTAITTYTDTSPSLIGCTIYYYAIAPVTCDATLITDDSGDDDTKRYVEADYAITYGDGTTGSPAGSDTAPKDGTEPGSPDIVEKANGTIVSGYKRSYITFTNPADTDFDHTLIYYSTTAYPTVDTDKNSPNYGVISGGVPVPDTNNVAKGIKGWFEGAAGTVSFVHDSETGAALEDVSTMHVPALVSQSYYYLAVAYDRCGNPKADAAEAITLAELCGDGSVGSPEWGPPDAPTGASVSGCSTSMTVSWNPITATADINPDAAGYRVYRSPTATFNTTLDPSDLNGTTCSTSPNTPCYLGFVPIGGATTFTDASLYGLAEGSVYSYGIVSTDCVYENRYIPSPLAEVGYKFNNSKYKQGWQTFNGVGSNGVTPGRIKREAQHLEALTRDSSGDKTKDTVKAVDPTVVTSPEDVPTKGYHNTVKLYFRNTSQGKMTINSISNIQWNNPDAKLAKVSIGWAEYTACSIIYNTLPTPPAVWVTSTTPGPSAPTSIALTGGVQVSGSCLNVPITLEFRDSVGSVNESVDMRGKDVRMALGIKNDSTNTTSCSSYLTVTEEDIAIPVDKGPSFDSDGDGTDNVILSAPDVTATSPTNVPSSGGVPDSDFVEFATDNAVTVEAKVIFQDIGKKICSDSVNLYYGITDRGGANTTPPSSFPTKITMSEVGSGTFQASINRNRNKRIWFYAVGQDDHDLNCITIKDRNFDRTPEVASGYYAYDQTEDPCGNTPNAPSSVLLTNVNSIDVVGSGGTTGSGASGSVSLSWSAVTTNTDGDSILDLKGYRVYVQKSTDNGLTWSAWSKISTDPNSSLSFSYIPTDSNGTRLKYYVTAYDNCSPTPKESTSSDVVGPVVIRTCSAVPNAPTVLTLTNGQPKDVDGSNNIGLSWTASTSTDVSGYRLYVSKSTNSGSTWTSSTVDVGLVTTYPYPAGGDVSGTWYKFTVKAVDYCSLESAASSEVGPVVKGTCSVAPNAPTNLSVNHHPAISGGTITLKWTSPDNNDLGGFKVYESVDGAAYAEIADVAGSMPITNYTYTRTPPAGTLRYTVKAYDKCYPTTALSADSNILGPIINNGCPGAKAATAPTLDTTYPLCDVPSQRKATIPATLAAGGALTDAQDLNVYYCSVGGAACTTKQLIDVKALPNPIGGYTYEFALPPGYSCGSYFAVSIVRSCGTESAISNGR